MKLILVVLFSGFSVPLLAQKVMTMRQLHNYQPGDIIYTEEFGDQYGSDGSYNRYKRVIISKVSDSAGIPGYIIKDTAATYSRNPPSPHISSYHGLWRVPDPDSSVWKWTWETGELYHAPIRFKDTLYTDTCNRLHYIRYVDNNTYFYDSAHKDSFPFEGEEMLYHFIEGIGYTFWWQISVGGLNDSRKDISYCTGDKCHCDKVGIIYYNGVQEFEKTMSLRIYPNPAADRINISGFPIDKILGVEIIALDGRTLIKSQPVKAIDITTLKAGIYLVKISIGNSIHYGRFVKQ